MWFEPSHNFSAFHVGAPQVPPPHIAGPVYLHNMPIIGVPHEPAIKFASHVRFTQNYPRLFNNSIVSGPRLIDEPYRAR